MTNLKYAIRAVFAMAALAFGLAFALHRANLARNRSNFKKLQIGMTKEEVKALMGEPTGSYENRHSYSLSNPGPFINVRGVVEFRKDTVVLVFKDTID
jgi:hypothetical protein